MQRVFEDTIETRAYYNAMENDEPLEVIEQVVTAHMILNNAL